YRAGFPVSFTKAAAPEGCGSIYLEIAVRPGEPWDEEALFAQARAGLIQAGILRASDRIVARAAFYINPAYVIYDEHRRDALPRILEELKRRGIHSIGRYGSWYYNSMEDSLSDGRLHAQEILEREL
ncbi:MAG TPA: hypothetical protein VFG76_11885, partial [Candidatus Polarisedimenticolia bacterium]|nr:hypothetical protein [Candidatus Polarisedimenticolia bacterium]